MTLKRIESTAAETEKLLTKLEDRERIDDLSHVYSGEHPDFGHTIIVVRGDGTSVAFADEVRFLGG